MKKIELGQTIGILANIGVIAGIIFLALELNQNNRLLEVEAVNSLLETRIARRELELNNPYLLAIVVKNQRGDPLTEEESQADFSMTVRTHLGWQKEYSLYQAGVLDEEMFRTNFSGMLRAISTNSGREFWEVWKQSAGPSYREFIESCVILECDVFRR